MAVTISRDDDADRLPGAFGRESNVGGSQSRCHRTTNGRGIVKDADAAGCDQLPSQIKKPSVRQDLAELADFPHPESMRRLNARRPRYLIILQPRLRLQAALVP